MTTLIIGGNGFIGRRVAASLIERGEDVVSADIAPAPAGKEVAGVRFAPLDITRFDSVVDAMLAAKPTRAINLAYNMNSAMAPHRSFAINQVGMDHFFEASRLAEVEHVVFSSSLAVNGRQIEFGDHAVTEDDTFHGARGNQYAAGKVFNEHQAKDYREKHGMRITSIRPANVTGHDKILGSSDHVRVITGPASGEAVVLPYRDVMRSIVYVDDVAEIIARIVLSEPQHDAYNTGGNTVSLGDLAALAAERIPTADVTFENETGGRDECTNYIVDNTRLREEYGFVPRSAEECVDAIIENVRREASLLEPAGAR